MNKVESSVLLEPDKPQTAVPKPSLTMVDAIAMIVGLVIGAGIFETPALVAANTGTFGGVIWIWLIGGVVSLLGAFCYAELATAYAHVCGNYICLYPLLGFSPRLRPAVLRRLE
jgi:amino acid transporter